MLWSDIVRKFLEEKEKIIKHHSGKQELETVTRNILSNTKKIANVITLINPSLRTETAETKVGLIFHM